MFLLGLKHFGLSTNSHQLLHYRITEFLVVVELTLFLLLPCANVLNQQPQNVSVPHHKIKTLFLLPVMHEIADHFTRSYVNLPACSFIHLTKMALLTKMLFNYLLLVTVCIRNVEVNLRQWLG